MRRALMILAFLGAALFGAAFVVSFLNPLLVERAAREVVRRVDQGAATGQTFRLS